MRDLRASGVFATGLLWFFLVLVILPGGCGEPVDGFDGFVKGQVEYLLGGGEGKAWQLVSRTVDGTPADPVPCASGALWVFVPDPRNDPKPLLYMYDPLVCDSVEFCTAFPDYCRYDSAYCAQNPQRCSGLPANILNTGTWEVKDPEILNTPTDTVYLHFWDETLTIHLRKITAGHMHTEYVSVGGALVQEEYVWQEGSQ